MDLEENPLIPGMCLLGRAGEWVGVEKNLQEGGSIWKDGRRILTKGWEQEDSEGRVDTSRPKGGRLIGVKGLTGGCIWEGRCLASLSVQNPTIDQGVCSTPRGY